MIFLPLECGSAWLSISTIPRYLSHMKHPFDYYSQPTWSFPVPSSSLFPNLQHPASGGPVIIVNASKYSYGALIVFLDRDPVHIPLQITQTAV